MPTLAVAHLRNVTMGPAIVEYLQRIDGTLAPFGGRFLVHGARPEQVEGTWTGDLVIVRFPDRESARAWYASPDRKSTRLNSSHRMPSRMPSSA